MEQQGGLVIDIKNYEWGSRKSGEYRKQLSRKHWRIIFRQTVSGRRDMELTSPPNRENMRAMLHTVYCIREEGMRRSHST